MDTETCPGCGAEFPKITGPVHAYMTSSPGCWAAFGRVLAREYSNPDLLEVHRLSVDAYAVQHPGTPDPRCIRSVGVHLIRLCLLLEDGLPINRANDVMVAAAKYKDAFVWLTPPDSMGLITVAEVADAGSALEHKQNVRAWAQSAWSAWETHHETIRRCISAQPGLPRPPKQD